MKTSTLTAILAVTIVGAATLIYNQLQKPTVASAPPELTANPTPPPTVVRATPTPPTSDAKPTPRTDYSMSKEEQKRLEDDATAPMEDVEDEEDAEEREAVRKFNEFQAKQPPKLSDEMRWKDQDFWKSSPYGRHR